MSATDLARYRLFSFYFKNDSDKSEDNHAILKNSEEDKRGHKEWRIQNGEPVTFEYSRWLKGSIMVTLIDSQTSGYADFSSQLLLRACQGRDANNKRMVDFSQELAYLGKETHARNGELEEQ